MTKVLREVFAEASRLGLRPWERLVLILAAAFFLVMGKQVGAAIFNAIKNAEIKPGTGYDEHGRDASAPITDGVPADPDPFATDPTRGSG